MATDKTDYNSYYIVPLKIAVNRPLSKAVLAEGIREVLDFWKDTDGNHPILGWNHDQFSVEAISVVQPKIEATTAGRR